MSAIEAFVGHSFNKEDKDLVNNFLEWFNHLTTILSFRWEHAAEAKAKDVSDKVFGLMDGKNTFICICTKKEQILKNINYKKCFWFKNLINEKESEIIWKTSDWLIQEIGFAIGRGMN